MVAAESIQHIVRDERGVAWIAQCNVKVIEVVLDHIAYGWSADAMHEQHSHLSLAQIHAALAFYYDHQAEFDTEIDRQAERLKALREAAGESPVQRRLRTLAKPL
jgi:uncharacterized protein (DUF433 family)